jgi:hypothetical protein
MIHGVPPARQPRLNNGLLSMPASPDRTGSRVASSIRRRSFGEAMQARRGQRGRGIT